MDAFFASVEERDKPYLKGLPVIVGSDPQNGSGRGVVSTANYKARELGIGSAMPIQKAWKLCEESRKKGGTRCVFVTSGFHRYGPASREVFTIVRKHVPVVAQASIDEAYLDLTFCKTFKTAKELAERIKKEITKSTKLTCSIGIGNSKMIAKIASDFKKPDGLTVIYPRSVDSFLKPLSIRALPGVGKKAEASLHRLGIRTVGDLQAYSWNELQRRFGKHGFSMWERSRGIDDREITPTKPQRKSIGKHHTFAEDVHDMEIVLAALKKQIQVIVREVGKQGFTEFRTVVLTVRFEDFITVTRSLTLEAPIATARELELKAIKLLLPFFEQKENPKGKAIRLVGIRVEKLS